MRSPRSYMSRTLPLATRERSATVGIRRRLAAGPAATGAAAVGPPRDVGRTDAAVPPRMPASVLAAFDPVTQDPAPVRFGAAVAAFTGARLLVGSVFGGDDLIDRLAAGQLAEEPLAERSGVLEEAVRRLRAGGADAEAVELGATSAARALSLGAEELGAGLVVVGSSARGRPGRLDAGSTASRLLGGCPCAVAVVPLAWEGGVSWDTIG